MTTPTNEPMTVEQILQNLYNIGRHEEAGGLTDREAAFAEATTQINALIAKAEIEAEYKGKRKMLRRMVVKGHLGDVTAIAYLTLCDAEKAEQEQLLQKGEK